jgi:[acyl-carrier-protein] S-malonyltransferase
MAKAAHGAMTALIGFDRVSLDNALQETPDVVLANDNTPRQVVISGKPDSIQQLLVKVKTERAIPLDVSGAFHSPLMASSSQAFETILQATDFADAQCPVLSNAEPEPTVDADILKERLSRQMTNLVRWRETSLKLAELGIETVVQIGPGHVLTGLIEKTCKSLDLKRIANLSELSSTVSADTEIVETI